MLIKLKDIDKEKKVLPKPEINKIIQNRQLEKTFINNLINYNFDKRTIFIKGSSK